jgi:predicted nucleic acid-binding protein
VEISVVDTGPLYAVLDANDRDHLRSVQVLQRRDLELVIPALVVAEVAYLAGRRLGPVAEAAFLRGLESLQVEAPSPDEWPRIAALVEEYRDFPLGGTDASVVALAERYETDLIVTLDRRHFGAIRPRHVAAFHLLPD